MLFLHVLILSLLSGGSARVVQDFERECGQFFANGKSPTRFPDLQYRQICQTLDNDVYYAMFYDTNKKIPVYSIQDYLCSAFYDTIVAKQIYSKFSFYNRFILLEYFFGMWAESFLCCLSF